MYREGLPQPESTPLFNASDFADARAHDLHISAGVQETPDHDIAGDHLSEQQGKWLRSMERADAARETIKNLPIDTVLQNCEFQLAQSGRHDLVLQISFKGLVIGSIRTATTAAKYASEKEKDELYAVAREYITRLQNPVQVERVRPVGHAATAASLNPWNPRGDFGGK